MILFEFEGKSLLSKYGIDVPANQLVKSPSEKVSLKTPLVVKAQVLSGKRKAAGGIVMVENNEEIVSVVSMMLEMIVNKEKVQNVLMEEKIEFTKEYYLSCTYDTGFRSPVITYSEVGGTGVEDRKSYTFPVNILTLEPSYPEDLQISKEVKAFIPKLLKMFIGEDATLVEINPLVLSSGKMVALDAKVKLDDEAKGRHKDWSFPTRSAPGHSSTKNETEAKKIDEGDYRGTAGSTYFDLPGDIAVLASGGGASLTAMDALLSGGGKPANYTEYSGNPPKEKVEKLTKIVLSKKDLHGLWIVGAIANFTDIYETLSGFLAALRQIKPKPTYPIVIRRGGPNDKKAFEMLKKIKEFDLHLYGQEISITESAKIIADLTKKHAATA